MGGGQRPSTDTRSSDLAARPETRSSKHLLHVHVVGLELEELGQVLVVPQLIMLALPGIARFGRRPAGLGDFALGVTLSQGRAGWGRWTIATSRRRSTLTRTRA